MALDPKLKAALKSLDLAAVQARWQEMSERQRPSTTQISEMFWSSAPVISPEIAQWMVDEGANPRVLMRNKDGALAGAASRAMSHNNVALLAWLVETGVQPLDQSVVPGGASPIEEALLHPRGARLDIAAWLQQQGVDMNQQDRDGNTLLARAAGQFNLEAIVWLVEQGVDPLIENARGEWAEQQVPEDGLRIRAPYNAEEVYAFLAAYTQAHHQGFEGDFPIPEAVLDQRAVERVGTTFKARPPEAWTEDDLRSIARHEAMKTAKGPSSPDPQHVVPSF